MAPLMRIIALATIAILLSTSLAVAKHRHCTIPPAHDGYVAVYDDRPGDTIAAAAARA